MLTELILIVVLFLSIYYLIFLLKIYFGLKKLSPKEAGNIPNEFVSVIIPFRNEEKNILNTYNNLVNQEYPKEKFEILFIDDFSEDNSLQLLNNQPKESNVFIFTLPDDFSKYAYKKRALKFGIEKARGEIIVTTDADCLHPPNWLKNLLKFMDYNTGFVSGPVEFISLDNLFIKMQKLEFAGLVIVGAGLIGSGNPIICNAANIAYRKNVFDLVGGFDSQKNLSSGDDELLMQKIHRYTDYKIKFALDKNSVVLTYGNSSIKDFYNQRKRWASKGLFYNDHFLIIKLVLIFLFYLSLIIQPILGITVSSIFFISFIFSFLIKIIFEFILIKKGVELLFDKGILKPYLITQILQIPYIVIAGFMGTFGNFVWKNRIVAR